METNQPEGLEDGDNEAGGGVSREREGASKGTQIEDSWAGIRRED